MPNNRNAYMAAWMCKKRKLSKRLGICVICNKRKAAKRGRRGGPIVRCRKCAGLDRGGKR